MFALTSGQKHPIILHRTDRLAKLICTQLHVDNLHVGPTALLALMTLQFHVIGAKYLAKSISRSCVHCRKVYAQTNKQFMGQLPASRVTPIAPFQHTGADFAGPILVKRGYTRARTLEKTYICIFECMATKAVHLEVVRDLSTEGLLAALHCFVARRGCPSTLAADNGSNFIGTQKELTHLYNLINTPKMQNDVDRYCTAHHIQWTHIPTHSSHFRDLWDAAVKSMKQLFTKTVGPHNYLWMICTSLLLRSRHFSIADLLLHWTPHPTMVEVLTPGHFLIGHALRSIPVTNHSNRKFSCLTRWNLCQCLAADIWDWWSKEYITHLQVFPKCHYPKRSVAVNDIVLLKDTDLFIQTWPLGRVVEVHPGKDGLVCVVTIKTTRGIY